MSILHQLGSISITWIQSLGYFGIFIGMVLESACIPIPSEVIMPFAGYLVYSGHMSLVGATIAGTLGNLVGSLIAYGIGNWGGRTILYRYGKFIFLSHKHLQLAEQWFEKRGEIAVFVSRILPAIRTFISLPAGIAKMNLSKFVLYTVIGSLPWSFALALVGYLLGQNWEHIQTFLHPIAYLIILVVVIWIVRIILKLRASNRIREVD